MSINAGARGDAFFMGFVVTCLNQKLFLMSETVSSALFGNDRTRHPTLGMKTDFALQHWITDVTHGWSSTVGRSQFNRNQMAFLWIKILIECVYVSNAGALMCLCMWMCVLYLWISCAVVAGMYPWSQSSHWANCQHRPAGSANTAALLSRGFSGALCVWHKRSGWESLTSTAIRWGFQTNMWKDTLHFPQNCYGWISDESTIYSTLTCMMTIEKKKKFPLKLFLLRNWW